MSSLDVRSAIKGQITVAWLIQRHVALTSHEAVALVLEIADVLALSVPSRLPPYQEVAITADGTVRFLRPPARAGDNLTTLVDILRAVLPADSPSEVWDIASAAAPDSPSHDTVDRLAAALRALEPTTPGRREILSTLYRRTVDHLSSIERDRLSSENSHTEAVGDTPTEDVPGPAVGDDSPRESTGAFDTSLVLEPTLAEIADSLNAASSCWRLSTEDTERPYHRTMSEVTQVELQRATWLVEGLRLLTKRPALTTANRNLGLILARVFQLTKPERRLNGVRLLTNLADTSVMIPVDERLGVLAYGSMLQATLALVRHVPGAVVRCEVSTTPSSAVVTLSQDSVSVPPALADRFFDESFPSRPGGSGAAVALAVAKRVMELHGGTATVQSMEPVGCRVSAQIPLAAARSEGG